MSHQGRLNRSIVHNLIDRCLQQHNVSITSTQRRCLRRVHDLTSIYSFLSNSDTKVLYPPTKENQFASYETSEDPSLPYYLVLLEHSDKKEKCSSHDNYDTIVGVAMWCFGYSTWKGRFMSLESMHTMHVSAEKLIMYALADIAKGLNCVRLVWQTKDSGKVLSDEKLYSAEFMKDWLTLSMDRDQMCSFSKTRKESEKPHLQSQTDTLSGASCVEDCSKVAVPKVDTPYSTESQRIMLPDFILGAIHKCITSINTSLKASTKKMQIVSKDRQKHKSSEVTITFQIRLAQEKDAPSILHLVQCLATYEKEPDAVHATADTYARDLGGNFPLCYCLLLEEVVKSNNNEDASVVGIGFWYLGGKLIGCSGRYLYLEDLYVDPNYRGRGFGKAMMYCIAKIAIALDCERFKWQALGWNTPALEFYDRIGAKVSEELFTLRLDSNGIDALISKEE